jgi:hypothetical protein
MLIHPKVMSPPERVIVYEKTNVGRSLHFKTNMEKYPYISAAISVCVLLFYLALCERSNRVI